MNEIIIETLNDVSKILKIKRPRYQMSDRMLSSTSLGYTDGNTIYLSKSITSQYDLAFTVAHECRHIYQIKNKTMEFESSDFTKTADDYNIDLKELDAHAFALIYMVSKYKIKPLFNGLSQNVIDEIYKRAEYISLHELKKD